MRTSSASTHAFRDHLRRLIRDLYGTAAAGVPARDVERAEARLGFALPETLADLYCLAGAHPAWTRSHHRLIAPSQLRSKNGALDFLREEQGVCWYAIRERDLARADPPVALRNQRGELHDECKRLSSFLVKSLCWQAIYRAEIGGEGRVSRRTFAKMKRSLEVVEHGAPIRYSVVALRTGGIVACVFPGTMSIYAAARSKRALDRFMKTWDLALDEF